MFVLTGIIEDIQFNAVRKETGWEVTQCNPHTGDELITVVNDLEFGATLALMVAGEELACTETLYSYANGMVQKQHDGVRTKGMTDLEEQAAFTFRMVP